MRSVHFAVRVTHFRNFISRLMALSLTTQLVSLWLYLSRSEYRFANRFMTVCDLLIASPRPVNSPKPPADSSTAALRCLIGSTFFQQSVIWPGSSISTLFHRVCCGFDQDSSVSERFERPLRMRIEPKTTIKNQCWLAVTPNPVDSFTPNLAGITSGVDIWDCPKGGSFWEEITTWILFGIIIKIKSTVIWAKVLRQFLFYSSLGQLKRSNTGASFLELTIIIFLKQYSRAPAPEFSWTTFFVGWNGLEQKR